MQTFSSFPAETICTCGYLTHAREGLHLHEQYDLTQQIGFLLIALGSMFGVVPLFRMYIKPGTAQLLTSIGRKLVRSAETSARMPC
jgi:hypothetical protein